MKNIAIYITLFFYMVSGFKLFGQQSGWTPDNGNGTFTNPVMWGDWPDPDIIRVGDDFYFISTSMHYVPGCPIAKSKDLVNWQMAGYAVNRYDEDPRYDMNGGTLYLNGSWANTLRYHNEKFYVGFCTPYGLGTEKGHFSICVADKIEGPWKRTIFPEYLYDPGLFFDDDGRVYVVHGQGTLYLTELASDALSVKEEKIKIWDKPIETPKGSTFPYPAGGMEGSHMYKINGYYYITCPAGGTEGWQMCLRSKNITGPYESKIICQDESTYPNNGLHQGGMVQLKNGDWWFIIMQDRGTIGRVPNLLPVTWIDGWPMLGENGKGIVTDKKPDVGSTYPISIPATSDEFNSPKPGLQWQWNHNPDDSRWSLTERKGYLRIKASRANNLENARNTLTQRVQGPASQATIEMDVSRLKDGNIAGLAVFQLPYAFVAVKQEGNLKKIIMENENVVVDSVSNFNGKKVWFRADVTHVGFTASFSYSFDGRKFIPIGNKLKMGLGWAWTANRFALFNYSTKETGVEGIADFNWVRFITNK